jgi:hypothetical protein
VSALAPQQPIDLRAHFGDRYRVCWEANGTTRSAWPEAERSWLLELRCKYGIVYPQGGAILAATITSRQIGRRVAALSCIRTSRGDVERVVTFHLDDAELVLALLKPHRRRQVSPEERERLVALGRLHGAVGLARAHQQRRHGRSDLSKPLENDPRIDAAAETDLGPTTGLSDAGDDMRGAAVRPTDIANSSALSVKQVPRGRRAAARTRMGDT